MSRIDVTISDKHATAEGSPVIVCGNSDYYICFTYDEEWEQVDTKTARFVYLQNGQVKYEDILFVGDIVRVPLLTNIKEVHVGLFAGDLITTAPARIPCELSIRCGTDAPADPTPSQYDQIMALLNATVGASAYEIAQNNGFEGTEEEWLESLRGEPGPEGPRGATVAPSGEITYPDAFGMFFRVGADEKAELVNLLGSYFALGDNGLDLSPLAGQLWFAGHAMSADMLNKYLFNVKQFGAKGDGSTNDTTALNNAFKECNANGGGIVYFPPGEYIVQSNYVEFFSNTHIIGVPGKTVITYPTTAKDWLPQALLRNNTTASVGGYDCTKNVIIENIIFDNRLSIAKKVTTVGVGHAENITFRNCKWTGCNGTTAGHCHYIELNACKNVKIIDCIFDKARSTGSATGNKEGIYSEMVNIDAAYNGAYGQADYYKFDSTACEDIEIKGCKFISYKQSDLGTTYRMAPAIGSHSDASHVGLRVHDCLFEGDWNSQDAERRATIILFGTNKNCAIYNNTFVAATAGLSKAPVGVNIQCTEKSTFIHDNKFINYDPANFVFYNESEAIGYNNYCLTTSSGAMVTDSGTINLADGVLSIA